MVPKVGNVLNGWMRQTYYNQMTRQVIDFENVETPVERSAMMNIQPMPQEKVQRKPEEQRSWKWVIILTKQNLGLNIDDTIVVRNRSFRIDAINDNQDYGFFRYECQEGFTEEVPAT